MELVVTDAWRRAWPGAAAGVLLLEGLEHGRVTPGLSAAREALERDLRTRLADRQAVRELPRAQCYAAYYKRFKKTYQVAAQLESVAVKGRSIPEITGPVTAMFMAEIKNLVLTAGHDADVVQPPLTLTAAAGDEEFVGMGGRQQQVKAGDMYISDKAGIISDVVYGPDERTKITAATRRALFCAYAPEGVGADAVADHLEDIESYLRLAEPGVSRVWLQVVEA